MFLFDEGKRSNTPLPRNPWQYKVKNRCCEIGTLYGLISATGRLAMHNFAIQQSCLIVFANQETSINLQTCTTKTRSLFQSIHWKTTGEHHNTYSVYSFPKNSFNFTQSFEKKIQIKLSNTFVLPVYFRCNPISKTMEPCQTKNCFELQIVFFVDIANSFTSIRSEIKYALTWKLEWLVISPN